MNECGWVGESRRSPRILHYFSPALFAMATSVTSRSAPATGEARGGKLSLGIASGQASFSLSAQHPQRYFPSARPFVHFHQTFPHPLMRVSRRFHFSAYPAFPLISTASIQLYKGILSLSTLPILERDFSRFLKRMNYEDKWQIIFVFIEFVK